MTNIIQRQAELVSGIFASLQNQKKYKFQNTTYNIKNQCKLQEIIIIGEHESKSK